MTVPRGVSDCCNTHSFNATIELIKLRNVYYLSNFSTSHPNFRDQEIQTNLFLYSNIHAHTMNMFLYSTLGHTCYLFLACSSHIPLYFFLFFFLPLFVSPIQTIFLKLQNQHNNIDFLFLHNVLISACETHHIEGWGITAIIPE